MTRNPTLVGIVFVLGGLALLAYVAFGRDDLPNNKIITGLPGPLSKLTPTASPQETQEFTAATMQATLAPEATSNPAAVARIQIPSIEIDATVVTLGVDPDGVMQSPHTPTDVGWYDFSAKPGFIGNAVFAAHVDYVNYGAAVFYRLRELQAGDQVVVILADGASFAYEVVSAELVDAATAPVAQIVGSTESATLTMITCAGAFDQNVLQYYKCLVVRAVRSLSAAGDRGK